LNLSFVVIYLYFVVDIWTSFEQSSAPSFCSTNAHSTGLLLVSAGTSLIRSVAGLSSARTEHSTTVPMCIAQSMTRPLAFVLMETSMFSF